MSMMCPPHRVKIVWTPSAFRAFATRWPPEMVAPAAVGSPAPDATVAPADPLRAVPGTVWVMGRSAPRGRGRFHTAYRMEGSYSSVSVLSRPHPRSVRYLAFGYCIPNTDDPNSPEGVSMKVAVVGAGAIGAYVGAALCRAGA